MKIVRRQSLAEITADCIRDGIVQGRWKGHLPGVRPLAEEFSVSKETLRAALDLLQQEGLLSCQGAGRFRKILQAPIHSRESQNKVLRVAVLLRFPLSQLSALSQGHVLALMHEIRMVGHHSFIVPKYLKHPGRDGLALRNLVAEAKADAWVIYSASYEVLSWFAQQKLPFFALGGHPMGLPISCARSDLTSAIDDAVSNLVRLGHRRIVFITGEKWLHPKPNAAAQNFVESMHSHGLAVTDYNMPHWRMSRDGLEGLLESLFRTTPPTAFLIIEPSWTVATLGWLLKRHLRVPEDVSLIAVLPDPALKYWNPTLAHFHWATAPHIQHALKWLRCHIEGSKPPGHKKVAVTFVHGESIGPAVK